MPPYRSRTSTHGRNMAGARGLWRATGMKDGDFGKPIIAIANSFTQFVPGHVHLKDLGQLVAREVEAAGGVAKEFDTIAVDDGIAMGHDGMLYSLPSRELIADSVEYMANAHCADALVCISNCDKITPGMLMAAMRLNIPAVFVSGGPMEAGKVKLSTGTRSVDLIDAMVAAADRQSLRRRRRGDRAFGLPDLRLLLGHVHRQFDELPDRGAGPVAARQRHGGGDSRRPAAPVRRGRASHRRSRAPLVRGGRRRRAAAWHRHLQGVRERHVARHRHGRFDQHRPASARRRARGRDRLHHGRHRPAVAPRAVSVQGRAVRGRRACRGRPSRRRRDGHSRRTRPRWSAQSRRPDGARRVARACFVAQRHHARDRQRDARILHGRARRRADPGRVQPVCALSLARRGSRQGRHPQFRACLLQGRRPRGAVRQHRARRLDREDGGGRRRQPQVQRPGAHLREPGRRGAGHPGRQGGGGRRGRHPLRGAARRPGHAGNALSDQLSEVARARQGLRPGHRRALLRRHVGPLDRPRLAGSGRGRRDRPGRRRRR